MSSSTATFQQHHKQQKYKTKQTLYIIRHGIAYHNLSIKVKLKSKDGPCDDGGDATSRGKFTYKYQHPDKRDPEYTDSKLVLPRAHQQARKAGRRLRKILQNNNIDECSATNSSDDSCTRTVRSTTGKTQSLTCVFVSPLTRCLETAYFVMNELMDDDDNIKRIKNDEIKVSADPPPWICKEDLREAFGIHYSDKRSSKSSLKEVWGPHVQFDENMTEEDEAWKPDQRETLNDLSQRIDNFLVWLAWNQLHCMITKSSTNIDKNNEHDISVHQDQFQEQHLLVVTHGVWMECLFRKFCPQILEGGRRVHNCDLYKADLVCSWKKKLCNSEGKEGSEWVCTKILLNDVRFIDEEP